MREMVLKEQTGKTNTDIWGRDKRDKSMGQGWIVISGFLSNPKDSPWIVDMGQKKIYFARSDFRG